MVIIGIDPGSRITGYGVIYLKDNQWHHLDSGCIRITDENTGHRLQTIFKQLNTIVERFQPVEAAIEQVFMSQNPGSALKLGQARGAAIVALNLPIAEYSARQVKQSVVGFGAAKKEQVQHMVARLLNIEATLQADEADALAIALCHAHSRLSLQSLGVARKRAKSRSSSWRDYVIPKNPAPEN